MKSFCTTPWKYNLDQKQMAVLSFQADLSVVNKMYMLKNELYWDSKKSNAHSSMKFHMYDSKRSLSSSYCHVLEHQQAVRHLLKSPVEQKTTEKNNFYILTLNLPNNIQFKMTTIN